MALLLKPEAAAVENFSTVNEITGSLCYLSFGVKMFLSGFRMDKHKYLYICIIFASFQFDCKFYSDLLCILWLY